MILKRLFCNHKYDNYNYKTFFVWNRQDSVYNDHTYQTKIVEYSKCKKCGRINEEILYGPEYAAVMRILKETKSKEKNTFEKETDKYYKKIKSRFKKSIN